MDLSAGKNDADYFLADNEQFFKKKAHLNFDMSFNICLDIKATFIICTTDNCIWNSTYSRAELATWCNSRGALWALMWTSIEFTGIKRCWLARHLCLAVCLYVYMCEMSFDTNIFKHTVWRCSNKTELIDLCWSWFILIFFMTLSSLPGCVLYTHTSPGCLDDESS